MNAGVPGPLVGLPDASPHGRLIVIGGGCYGSYHARQLARARERNRIPPHDIVIVDRDPVCAARREFQQLPGFHFVTATWDAFLDAFLDALPPTTRDAIVPTPLSPHLMFEWLRRRVGPRGCMAPVGDRRAPVATCPSLPDTPYAEIGTDGSGLLSFATWLCPVTCYEPSTCPKTRGSKDWEMDDAVFAWARLCRAAGRPFDLVEVFRCRHFAWGVAAYPALLAVQARDRLGRLLARSGSGEESRRLLVATVSSCHGIMTTLEIVPTA